MVFLIAVATFFSTMLGGLFALRLRDKLHLIVGFSAGAILGLVFFDLLPESARIGTFSFETIATIVAVGFAIHLILDRTLLKHCHDDEHEHSRANNGIAGASGLIAHSFLDGLGIGIAFQASSALGVIVAVAVLAHDFSDGINTVSMILKSGGTKARALHWLTLDALAPLLGVFATFFFIIPASVLAPILALMSGFFLYIAASDLIPEGHHSHSVYWTTTATIFGMALMYVIVSVA